MCGVVVDLLCVFVCNFCVNGGFCMVLVFGEVGCDCSYMGFGGKFCSEGEFEGVVVGCMGVDVWGGVFLGMVRVSVWGLGLWGYLWFVVWV